MQNTPTEQEKRRPPISTPLREMRKPSGVEDIGRGSESQMG